MMIIIKGSLFAAALVAGSTAHAAILFEQLAPTSTSYAAGSDFSGATFGAQIFDVSGTLFAVTRGDDLSLGCDAIDYVGLVAGTIAFVGRGSCNFTVKAALAQAAGASGVIIANDSRGAAVSMGGTDNLVNIPAFMVSYDVRGALFPSAVAGTAQVRMAAGVPEPASWAMMIAGLGLVGASLRRRPVATVAFG